MRTGAAKGTMSSQDERGKCYKLRRAAIGSSADDCFPGAAPPSSLPGTAFPPAY